MVDVDVAIVGQGIAGTTLAWHLRWRGVRVLLIDRREAVTASRIAAGLVTPITGKRLATTWRLGELWPAAVAFYSRVEAETGRPVFHRRRMVRLFATDEERDVFARKRDTEFRGRVEVPEPLVNPAWFTAPLGGFEMSPEVAGENTPSPESLRDSTSPPGGGEVENRALGFHLAPSRGRGRTWCEATRPGEGVFSPMAPAGQLDVPAYLDASRAYFADSFREADLDAGSDIELIDPACGEGCNEATGDGFLPSPLGGEGGGAAPPGEGNSDQPIPSPPTVVDLLASGGRQPPVPPQTVRAALGDNRGLTPPARQATRPLVRLPRLNIAARALVFCTGFAAHTDPWFGRLPFNAAKGEILTLRIPGLGEDRVIHRGVWLAPAGDGLFRAGSTYEWDELNAVPTVRRREEILARLREFLRLPIEVVGHHAAVRPVIDAGKPVLGFHPRFPQLACFNGLGSKGSLLAPFFADQLAAALCGEGEIDPAVNVAALL